MTTNELMTLGISAYAATISTFVLGWDAFKWLDSGPKILLAANPGVKLIGAGQVDPNTYVSVNAVNLGDIEQKLLDKSGV